MDHVQVRCCKLERSGIGLQAAGEHKGWSLRASHRWSTRGSRGRRAAAECDIAELEYRLLREGL